MMQKLKETILNYLNAVDSSIEVLSKKSEGKISGLPSWVLEKRKVIIGLTSDNEGVVIKIIPLQELEEDTVIFKEIKSIEEINEILSPMNYQGSLPNKLPRNNDFVLFGDISVVEADNPLAVPVIDNRCLIGWGRKDGFFALFNIEKAKKEAIEHWNNAIHGIKRNRSFIQEVRSVLNKLQAIIKRKAFLERRIHRFINEYSSILLPNHKRCLFEHKLYLGNKVRKADFILEREQGLPPILIELESPVHKVLRKNNDLTAAANHARQQIMEWISFIEKDPIRNASGEYSFLLGPKEKLIIIGRGVEYKERLIDTKFDGVTFWTYSMFIEEAKMRLNNHIASQYEMLGLKPARPF